VVALRFVASIVAVLSDDTKRFPPIGVPAEPSVLSSIVACDEPSTVLVFHKPTASGRGPKEVRTDPW
jgi:hypothetical protein